MLPCDSAADQLSALQAEWQLCEDTVVILQAKTLEKEQQLVFQGLLLQDPPDLKMQIMK